MIAEDRVTAEVEQAPRTPPCHGSAGCPPSAEAPFGGPEVLKPHEHHSVERTGPCPVSRVRSRGSSRRRCSEPRRYRRASTPTVTPARAAVHVCPRRLGSPKTQMLLHSLSVEHGNWLPTSPGKPPPTQKWSFSMVPFASNALAAGEPPSWAAKANTSASKDAASEVASTKSLGGSTP